MTSSPRRVSRCAWGVLQDERDLRERHVRERALGGELLHEPLERQLGVAQRFQADGPDAPQQCFDGGIAGQVEPEHERVDEAADQRLGLDARAAGDRRGDRDVGAARPAAEHDPERREQNHKRRHAGPLGDRREREAQAGAAEGLDGRARVVGGELEHGREAVELRAPVGEQVVENLPGQALSLPGGELRILQRERRERRERLAGVERAQLVGEQAHRPRVGDDVVSGHEQHVLAGAVVDQRRAHQWAGGEVEPAPQLGVEVAAAFEGELGVLVDEHHRRAVVEREAGA